MKKVIYGLCSLAIITTITFGAKSMAFGQEPAANQASELSQEDNQINKIDIKPYLITKNHSTYDCLTCGSHMSLLVKVYLKDGSVATGKDAEVNCELRKKDGTSANAVAALNSSSQNKSKIDVYAPFGSEEELELVVSSSQDSTVKQTYSFKTVADARDGVSIARYKLGTTVGNASVAAAKEVWDSNKKVYTITLPAVKTNNSADVFKGWKDDNGKVYASGKKICVDKRSLHTFCAVWKEQPAGTTFKVKEGTETTKYTIIGKGSVLLAQHSSIIKGPYNFEIPDTVNFHNKTYKVEAIGKRAFYNTSVQKLVIGKNIKKMGHNTFGRNWFLKTIVINSKKINYIGANAMKELKKDAVIQCPKSCIKTYTKLFRKAGINTNVTIKGI